MKKQYPAVICAALVLISALPGIFSSEIYTDFIAPLHLEESRGQDIITLFLGLPLLGLSCFLISRDRLTGRILQAGVQAYFLYIYLLYSFGGVLNYLYPAYLVISVLSLDGLAGNLNHLKTAGDTCTEKRKVLPMLSVTFFVLFTLILVFLWGGMIFDGIRTELVPDALIIIVLDLVGLLPAYIRVSARLIKHHPGALRQSGVLLVLSAILGSSIVVGQLVASAGGFHVDAGPVILFSVFTLAAGFLGGGVFSSYR